MSRKIPNASEMGKKGGNKLKEMKKGTNYYAEIRAKGRETILARDPDFYKNLAKKGLEARMKKKAEKEKENRPTISKITDILTGKS